MCSLLIGIISLIAVIYFFRKEPNQFRNIFFLMSAIYFSIRGFLDLWERIFPKLSYDGKSYVETSSGTLYFYTIIFVVLILLLFSWSLIVNFIILVRKEGFVSSYCILLVSVLSIYGWIIFRFIPASTLIKEVFNSIILYIPMLYIAYILYTKLYLKFVQVKEPAYIIIHGAALIDDLPTPLLKKRLDKGIELYNSFNKKPFFIVSGGQGDDEIVTESEAMKKYLLSKNVSQKSIIEEDKSRNTFENLLFSKHKIPDINKQGIIVSNEYHILRCVIYAKNVGLTVYGMPSQTVGYYKIFGEFREVLAFIVGYKVYFIIYLLLSLISIFLDCFIFLY